MGPFIRRRGSEFEVLTLPVRDGISLGILQFNQAPGGRSAQYEVDCTAPFKTESSSWNLEPNAHVRVPAANLMCQLQLAALAVRRPSSRSIT